MKNENNWYMIVLLLHNFEIEKNFEKFVKENDFIGKTESFANMTYEDLAKSVKIFLETEKDTLNLTKSHLHELLKYCNTK